MLLADVCKQTSQARGKFCIHSTPPHTPLVELHWICCCFVFDCKQRNLVTQNVSFIISFMKKHLTTISYLAQHGVDYQTGSSVRRKQNRCRQKHINLKIRFLRLLSSCKSLNRESFCNASKTLEVNLASRRVVD